MTTILQTIHGSHLYGLAHEGSDLDTYRVVLHENKGHARQKKTGDDDQMVISLDRFVDQVRLGVPQALEALFSPVAEIDPTWQPFLRGLRPGAIETQMRYRRTIVNFAFCKGGRTGASAKKIDERKLRRHALRLALNLEQFQTTGRIQPRLSEEQIEFVKTTADADDVDTRLRILLDRALSAFAASRDLQAVAACGLRRSPPAPESTPEEGNP